MKIETFVFLNKLEGLRNKLKEITSIYNQKNHIYIMSKSDDISCFKLNAETGLSPEEIKGFILAGLEGELIEMRLKINCIETEIETLIDTKQ